MEGMWGGVEKNDEKGEGISSEKVTLFTTCL